MTASAKLYTPQVLALATVLADYPLEPGFACRGHARSAVCGSAIDIGFDLDAFGRISAAGMKVHACAVGQAAAALFAQSVRTRSREDIAATLQQIESWLRGESEAPEWPGLEALGAARDYPGRHGAILLPWKAALDALP